MSNGDEEEGPTFEFDLMFQSKIAGLFSRDTTFARRVADLIEPSYFTEAGTAEYIRICKDHLQRFNAVPDKTTFVKILKDLVANKRLRDDLLNDVKKAFLDSLKADLTNAEYVAEEVANFAKHQAIQNAMMTSIPLLEKGDFSKIRELMATATQVGLNDSFEDYDYAEEIKSRTAKREDIANGVALGGGITTGYPQVDVHLYHGGWGRRELSCLMGPAKSGKSMALGDFAKNAWLKGFNVLYVSLEVSKQIISERIDASLTDTAMKALVADRATIEAKINTLKANAGVFKVIDFPSGTLKVSQLNRHLERYRDQGIIFDLVIVDYADLMAGENDRDEPREKSRRIYVDLRALAYIWDNAFLTATQTNREGAKKATADATDVGDDWNKVRTVDILIGISATEAEKQAGEARLKWLISRNTADGVTLVIKQDREKMQFLKSVLSVQ